MRARAHVCTVTPFLVGACALVSPTRHLCDVKTPAMLVDVDSIPGGEAALGRLCAESDLDGLLDRVADKVFLHGRVTELMPRTVRYHKDASYTLCVLDCPLPTSGAFLSMGLNNHWDADYYWARSAGSSARLPVPGIGLRTTTAGETVIKRLGEVEAAAEATGYGFNQFQPNDGKRSEWCEYLRPRDEVDLVPVGRLLRCDLAMFGDRIVGVTRKERPLGAEPVVAGEWRFGEVVS